MSGTKNKRRKFLIEKKKKYFDHFSLFFLFSWLTSIENEDRADSNKPKWFEEMIKKAVNAKEEESIESKENDDLFNLDNESTKMKDSNQLNQIYSKRRNTLNILQSENQTFLSALSKSAKSFTDKDNLIEQLNESKKLDDKNEFKQIDLIKELPDELIDLKKSKQSSSRLDFENVLKLDDNNLSNSIDNEDFTIPTSPIGQRLTIILKSNYGDENWIGLNGIEIFDLKTFKSLSNLNVSILFNCESTTFKVAFL